MDEIQDFYSHINFFTTPDRISIRYGYWPCDKASVGVLVLLNGRSEFLEKYKEPISILNRKGFDVFSMDWRGQGLSSRLLPNHHKGHIDSFDSYLIDLKTMLDQFVFPETDGPVFFLAHSMGGHIALRYLLSLCKGAGLRHKRLKNTADHKKIKGCVLCSPMIDIHTEPFPVWMVKSLCRIMVKTGKADAYAIGSTDYIPGQQVYDGNRLTSDPIRFQDHVNAVIQNPELAVGGVTYGWLKAAYRSMAIVRKSVQEAKNIIPLCMVGAADDQIVSVKAQKWVCQNLKNCDFGLVAEARHEILKEADSIQARFWALFDRFINRLAGS